MLHFQFLICAALVLSVVASGQTGRTAESKQTPVLEEFQQRVDGYLKLRKMVADQLPKLKSTSEAEQLAGRKAILMSSLKEARAGVMPGNIFTPNVAGEFRRLGKLATDGTDGLRVAKSLKRAEPVQVAVRVNEPYPPSVPLQSMPPTLLMGLPKLPKELEYRLVGKTLLLRDVEANLMVDFLPEAIP